MELSQEREIDAPRDKVWAALLDPEVLKDCLPGCQEMTGNADDGFAAVVTQKVGPVKATFKGEVKITDRHEPERARLEGQGKGGAAGFANGGADLRLEDLGDGRTKLSYDVEAKVGGKLAQLGGRVIDAFTKRLADQFFDNFKARVEDGNADATPETSDPVAAAASDNPPAGDAGPADTDPGNVEPTATGPAADGEGEKKKGWLGRVFGG